MEENAERWNIGMSQHKYCPLMLTSDDSLRNCKKDECAWWSEYSECIMKTIGQSLERIADQLDEHSDGQREALDKILPKKKE